jgi:hypothetical protein
MQGKLSFTLPDTLRLITHGQNPYHNHKVSIIPQDVGYMHQNFSERMKPGVTSTTKRPRSTLALGFADRRPRFRQGCWILVHPARFQAADTFYLLV